MTQGANWCFTLNNPKEAGTDLLDRLKPLCKRVVFQLERGADTHTAHFQGFIQFTQSYRLREVNSIFQAHWTTTRSVAASIIYCQKLESRVEGPWSHGDLGKVSRQGKRNDLLECANMVKQGKTLTEIADLFPTQVIRYSTNLERYRALYPPKRTQDLVVWLYIGKPGTGKTRTAHELFPELFRLPIGKDLWFNTYQQQPEVLIDDFSGNIGLTQLLQLLDRYPIQVPVKGGFTWWCPNTIIITTNIPIEDWYDYTTRQDSFEALQRRIHHTKTFEGALNGLTNTIIKDYKDPLNWEENSTTEEENWQ